jgi:hypothetical protein
VRGVRGELSDALNRRFDAREHFVERIGQEAQFVVNLGDFEAAGEILHADSARDSDDFLDGGEATPAEPVAYERRENDE